MMAAEDLKALAKILRGLRVDRGLEDGRAAWIVAKVAAKTGLSAGSISGYELGYYGPSRAGLEKLLDAYRAPEDLRARALQLHGCGAEGATPAITEAERVAEFGHAGRRYRATGTPESFVVSIFNNGRWRVPATKSSWGVISRARAALLTSSAQRKTMTETDAKDLTTVLCNLHDRIAGLQAALEALPAKIAEAIAAKQPVLQAAPSVPQPPKATPKPVPWPERLRVWLATPEAAKRLKDRTLTIAVLGNQLKHKFSPGERKALGRVLADEGLIRVAGAEGDYYIKDPL